MIPHVVHQIWKSAEVPREWKGFARSWVERNPDWEYRLWTDREIDTYVRDRYPHLGATYAGLSFNIQRADLARYLILHGCGGIYADLDLECLRPLSALLDGHELVACREPFEHARSGGGRQIIGNAFLASAQGHGLLEAVASEVARKAAAITFHQEVLTSTGPYLFTHVARAYAGRNFSVMDSRVAYPFANHAPQLSLLQRGGSRAEHLRSRLIAEGTWAVHYWANSWVRNLAGELRNPDPDKVPGYRFYPGWDSHGFDLFNGGRDVAKLARRSGQLADTDGFNTDGFVKYRLRPKIAWSRIPGAAWNEGLYVRDCPTGRARGMLAAVALKFAAARWTLRRRGFR